MRRRSQRSLSLTRERIAVSEGMALGLWMKGHFALTHDRRSLSSAFSRAYSEWLFAAFFPRLLVELDAGKLGWTTMAFARESKVTWSFYWAVSRSELTAHPRSELHLFEAGPNRVAGNIDGGVPFGADPWEELAMRFLELLAEESGPQS